MLGGQRYSSCVILLLFKNIIISGIVSIKSNFPPTHHFHGICMEVQQRAVVSLQAFRDGFPGT